MATPTSMEKDRAVGSKINNLDLTDGAHKRAVSEGRVTGGFVGDSGVAHTGGYISTEEKMQSLLGGKKFETFTDLLADISIVGAAVRLFLHIVSKSTWQVEAAKVEDGRQAQANAIAADLESMMHDHKTAWHRIVRRVAMYRFYGFSIQEFTAKKRPDGKIGFLDIQSRPQRTILRWDLDEQGEVLGAYQTKTDGTEALIPREKMIYAVDDSLTESPEGMGLLRHVVRPALRLKAFEELEEVGYENDLRGVPVAYGPLKEWAGMVKAGTKTKADYNRAKKPLDQFVNGHIVSRKTGMVFDSEVYRGEDDKRQPSAIRKWSAELLRGDAQGFDEAANVIKRLSSEIAIVLGCEHLLLGMDGSGSLALSKNKSGTFYLTVMTTMYELVEIFEDDWVATAGRLNGWPEDLLPSLAVEEIRDEDIEQITQALVNMAQAGAILGPDDPVIAEIRHMLGLSPPPEDADLDLELGGGTDDPPTEPGEEEEATEEDVEAASKHMRKWIRRRR